MQSPASVPTDQFSDPLKRLMADLDPDALALQTKAIQRERKIDSGVNQSRIQELCDGRPEAWPAPRLDELPVTCRHQIQELDRWC